MRATKLIICLFFCALGLNSQARGKGAAFEANTFSVYLKGGASMATGMDFQSVNPPVSVELFPEVGGGLSYEFSRSVRLGLNYDFNKILREQRLSAFEPTAPKIDKPGAKYEGGTAYRDRWTYFNSADFSVEYNFCNLISSWKSSGVNIYLGTGAGYLFANGNSYTVSMAHEEWIDSSNPLMNHWQSETWLNAHNEKHKYNAFYVPVSFSVEYNVHNGLSLGVRADSKFVISNNTMAPKNIHSASLVLRIAL